MLGSSITLTVRLGKQKTAPAPGVLIDAIQSVEVTQRDRGRAAFQIVFQVGRSGSLDLKDYQLVKDPLLSSGNRLILIVTLQAKAHLLMDGIITHQQLSPSLEPGASTFTITGEDITVMMDRKKHAVEHPVQDPKVIVEQILEQYRSTYGVIPRVISPPKGVNAPSANEQTPVKHGSDLRHILYLANRYGYVFYVSPGPQLEKNTAYWGPPKKRGGTQSQKALSFNLGSYTNVDSISLQHNARSPTKVFGRVQDRKTNQIQSFSIDSSDEERAFLSKTLSLNNKDAVQEVQYMDSGHTLMESRIRAQAITNQSVDHAVQITGDLDTARYGDMLQIRELVGLRGVGDRYNGLYYVQQVTHKLRNGEYKQSFTIIREGLDSTVDRLMV
jgi:hypothetical protein